MDDLHQWAADQEAQARQSGDRQAAQTWGQRRLRLRAYRQGLMSMLGRGDTQPPV